MRVCVSLRYLHPGEDAVTGQRLPPSSPELRRRSRPAEQTQRDAAVHPVHGGHEAAVREVERGLKIKLNSCVILFS